ncbi:MAG: tetratricopeptide repeat protein [Candidatus Marinimicrobia bacterium]|nr:tetratricopeptide repeat protein [Candidatus Neomarinimicrobiota bacterium]
MVLRTLKSSLGLMGVLGFLLLAGCRATSETTLPVTTQSEPAREMFLAGRELYENLRIGDARELFDLAIKKDPLFAQAQLYRSLTPRSAADGQKHRRHAVSLANKVSPGEKLMIAAMAGEGLGNSERAVELLKELIGLHPQDKRAHLFLGQIYHFRIDDKKSAIKEYKRAIKIDKNYAPPYNLLGYVYADLDKFRDAEKALDNYIRLIPDEPNPYDSMADLLTRQGRLEKANEFFAKAFDVNSRFTVSQMKLGANLIMLEKYDEGRAAMKLAIEYERDNRTRGDYLAALSVSHLYSRDADAALESLLEVSSLAQEFNLDALLHRQLRYAATIYLSSGQFSAIAAIKDKIEDLIAQGGFEENLLNRIHAGQAQMAILEKAARKEFETAQSLLADYKLKVDSENPSYELANYHTIAGYLDVEMENFEAALEHLEHGDLKALDLFNMARAHEGLGHMAKAKEHYRKHTQLYTYNLWYALTLPQSREALTRL